MKKIFTLAAAMIAALSVNAQEVCQIDAEGAGLTSDAADVAAGTVVGTSENLTITVLNADQVKSTSCKGNNSGFVIGGAELKASGITGSNNPKDETGANPAVGDGTTVGGIPVTGFAVNLATSSNVAEGTYAYVAGKLSSNKNYYVFENGLCIGYELAMWCDKSTALQPLKIIVENDAETDGVPYRTASIAWPEVIFTGDDASAIKQSGEGVIVFPVYAECNYIVGAGGSKISVCGAVLTSSNTVSVVLPETEGSDGTVYPEVTLVAEGSTPGTAGINAVAIDKAIDANAPAYNIAGQRVNKDAKGLIIVGGKKILNK